MNTELPVSRHGAGGMVPVAARALAAMAYAARWLRGRHGARPAA